MALLDLHSFANYDELVTTHLSLDLTCEFDKRRFSGVAEVSCKKLHPGAEYLCLDATGLEVASVTNAADDSALDFDTAASNQFGGRLRVKLPEANATKIRVAYRTSVEPEAVQWLAPEQTAGKQHPFCFTQCQAILARTIFPCQDTPAVKAPFSFRITVPQHLMAVASGNLVGDPVVNAKAQTRTFCYEQPVAVMAYLVAVCCGNLDKKAIGPRSAVYAEPELLEAARAELDGVTETFILEAEKICGLPYQWGTFDVLVLPRSFAYGGMENPNLTFFSSSLIAGDRSLTTTLAHEITHSWSGNWVTNASWTDFWLNEGFTRYIERRILGQMHGDGYRGLLLTFGYFELIKAVDSLKACPNHTRLQPDLSQCSPDDAFSRIPYEKGSLFLFYLETIVGGAGPMAAWLSEYFRQFAQRSIATQQMRDHFTGFFGSRNVDVSGVDWDHWLHGEGLPDFDLTRHIDGSMNTGCRRIADCWREGGAGASSTDFAGFKAHQVMVTLDYIINDGGVLTPDTLAKMDRLYGLRSSKNVEVSVRWLLLNLRNRNKECYAHLAEFLGFHGRGSYVKPLYMALNSFDHEKALELFDANKRFYMATITRIVANTIGAVV